MRARLDRGVASTDWSDLLPQAQIQHVVTSRSDHFPLVLSLGGDQQGCKNKYFRYEMMWERVQSLETTVREAWGGKGDAKNLEDVSKKLKKVQKSLVVCPGRTFELPIQISNGRDTG